MKIEFKSFLAGSSSLLIGVCHPYHGGPPVREVRFAIAVWRWNFQTTVSW